MENRLSDAPPAEAAGADTDVLAGPNTLGVPEVTVVLAPKPVPNPSPVTAEKLNPDAEPKPEGAAAAEVLSEAANEKEEAEGAGEAPNPDGGGAAAELPNPEEGDAVGALPNPEGGGAVGALPNPEGGGADTEEKPDAGAAKLKLLTCSDVPKLLLAKPNVGAEPKPVDDPCGAVLFSSLSKAALVAAFITFSS